MYLIPVFKIGLWNAWIFMSVFILQMLAMMFADERIRKKSHVPAEAKQNKSERFTGIIANLIWLSALVYSIFLPFKLGTAWFYIGFFVFIIGLILMTRATFDFITTPSDQVIKKGVYKFSRHPMYLATFFICLGSGISSGSWLFIILSVIMAVCFHKEAMIEERYCLEKYGDNYQKYMNGIPRWIGLPEKIK